MGKRFANEIRWRAQVMRARFRKYAWSLVIALILTVLVGAVASVPRWSAVGVLLAPGVLAGAIVFPEGTNSDWPGTYMAMAALMNAFVLSWPVLGAWLLVERARGHNQGTRDTQ